jgi:probable phosphoglycerate mutase
VLIDEDGVVIAELARGIGEGTNNVAEYSALIAGLELALEHGVEVVDVFVDSELVAAQVRGEWKIRNDRLRALAVRARSIMGRFREATISHVPRADNAAADALANQGMDAAESGLDGGTGPASLLE